MLRKRPRAMHLGAWGLSPRQRGLAAQREGGLRRPLLTGFPHLYKHGVLSPAPSVQLEGRGLGRLSPDLGRLPYRPCRLLQPPSKAALHLQPLGGDRTLRPGCSPSPLRLQPVFQPEANERACWAASGLSRA